VQDCSVKTSKEEAPHPFRIVKGNCLAGMRRMEAGSVDIVVTSPPYNLGIAYSSYKDTLSRKKYLAWCRVWMTEILRVLSENGSFFLNVGASPKEPLFPHQMALLACECGWKLQNTFHWVKSISVPDPKGKEGDFVSVGHFKPINSRRFVNDCHEYVFHLTKTGTVPLERLALGVPYQDKSNIARWGHTGGRDVRCRGNLWFVPYETINCRATDRPHPATFPVELARNCLKIAGANSQTRVMDPFLGIGSSAVAARLENVGAFTGFDIDAEYVSVAKARLAEAAGKTTSTAHGAAREA
jgi:site-specific DNA-methyltransferase (adenine-specific)